jgi:hypothetical protein
MPKVMYESRCPLLTVVHSKFHAELLLFSHRRVQNPGCGGYVFDFLKGSSRSRSCWCWRQPPPALSVLPSSILPFSPLLLCYFFLRILRRTSHIQRRHNRPQAPIILFNRSIPHLNHCHYSFQDDKCRYYVCVSCAVLEMRIRASSAPISGRNRGPRPWRLCLTLAFPTRFTGYSSGLAS